MAKRKMTREDVEREIERARRADEEMVTGPDQSDTIVLEDLAPKLDQADLRRVDLSGLDLTDGSLRYADLRGAILISTLLAGAYLNHADLRDTTETKGADLSGVTMHLAYLEGTDLSEVSLTPAVPEFLSNATYDERTRWPHGFDPAAHGARKVGRPRQ